MDRHEEVLEGQKLIEQLRVVFDACDTEGLGLISLRELGNISRSHVGRGQVDQILDILDPGEETQDTIDFDQFHQKFVEFMNSGDKVDASNMRVVENNKHNSNMTNLNMSPGKTDQGVFNENLRRSFEKNSISTTSSPYKSPNNKQVAVRNMRRKTSQARLSGRIPLVNTSSEDEAEDSFDRKIASSLALARPLDIQPQYLVRGSNARSTVRKTSTQSQPSPTMSTSTRKFSTASRPSPTSTIRMSPILVPSDGSSFNSPMSSSSTHSDRSGRGSPRSGGGSTRLALDELQRKVGQLAETAVGHQEDYDSPSSGVGSLRADLEEEINSSLLLARKHGEERLVVERQRYAEQMEAVERERDMERRNFQLRFDQFQKDKDMLRREVDDLKEKVMLVNMEKEHIEEQMAELVDQQRCQSPLTAVKEGKDEQEEQRRRDRDEEMMNTVQHLTDRVQSQDQELAEAKEDVIVLRKQVSSLKEGKGKESREGSRFRIFGGGKESSSAVEDGQFEDPQDIRVKLRQVEQELSDQKEANCQLKQYVGEVLVNIMVKNPQILEKN
eukprot:GFUD01027830.1.p1 GENE.GFUD01027830.1~~GFUD01027830.1.p1  ORF type:complete len:556 (+),score=215.44 GFUD01027830.1:174-1841(+)